MVQHEQKRDVADLRLLQHQLQVLHVLELRVSQPFPTHYRSRQLSRDHAEGIVVALYVVAVQVDSDILPL